LEQKENWYITCQDLLPRLEIEPNFLDKVIVEDESWAAESKHQSEGHYSEN